MSPPASHRGRRDPLLERILAEDELRALEADEKYAVIRYAHDFRVTGWSRGATLLFGWTAEEALARGAAELINLPATAQEQQKIDDLRRELLETGEVRIGPGVNFYAKDGRPVLLDAHVFATEDGYVGVMTGRLSGGRGKWRQVNLRLPDDLLNAIESLRGDMPRERFLRMVIATYVETTTRKEPPG